MARPANANRTELGVNTADERATEDMDREYVSLDTPWARLSHPDLPGFHCHWVNDTPGRVDRFKRAGYQIVTREEVPFFGDRSNDPSQREGIDNQVRTVVDKYDNGEAIWGILMKIPLKIYNSQQRARELRELEKLSAASRQGQEKDRPGADELYPTQTGIRVGPNPD